MSENPNFVPIRSLIEGCWPGEWGLDPVFDNANCVVFRATNIDSDGHLDLEGGVARFILPAKLNSKTLELGDILLEAAGGAPDKPVGRVALVNRVPDQPSLTTNFFRFIRPAQNVDARFLLLQLVALNRSSSIWRYQQQTTGLINLKVEDYLKHKIWAPSKARQRKIADGLFKIDTVIKKTEALIEKYQQIKAGLMHDLFSRGVLPNGQLRPPREQAPELYKETAIGWAPREWKVATLRDCLDNNPTNGIYKSAESIGEGTLMVGQTAFTAERSIDFSLCRRGAVGVEEVRQYGLSKDDILLTRVFATVQGVGLPTLVPEMPEPAVFESNMIRLQIDSKKVLPRFLFEWLRTPQTRRHIISSANASNQCSVNQSVLNPLPVPLPTMREQLQIEARTNQIDKRHSLESISLSKLHQKKLGLMQDLLTGKVPVHIDEQVPELAHA